MTPEPAGADDPDGPGRGPVPHDIEDACEELIRRWGEGDRVPAEAMLALCPAPVGPDDAFEVVYLEYLLREAQGEDPLADLAARFPALAARLDRQVAIHRAIQLDPPARDGDAEAEAGVPGAPGRPPGPARDRPSPAGFEIIRELGRGGMGVVYLARQTGLDRPAALKMILAGPMALILDHARFLAEGRAVARLQHPNIVQVYHVGEHDGQPFIAMEYVDGGSLADDLDGTPRPARVVAATVRAVALGIAEAHRRGVIHRDLKPSNVLVKFDGTPKVADFGLAKLLDADQGLTMTGALMGSPRYMAPEQAAGPPSAVGPAADVYAIGAILYELLTGRPPFAAETPMATLELVRNSDPVAPTRLRPHLPRDLETICLTCLAKEPAARYASAEALADDLGSWLDGRPIRARPLGAWGRSLRWARRNRAVASLLATVILLLAAGAAGMTVLWTWARDEARAQANSRVEAQRLAAGQALDRGLAQAESGDVARGLHSMAEALRIGGGSDPDLDRAARANVAAWSALVPPPVASHRFAGGGGPSGISPDGRTGFVVEDKLDVRVVDLETLRPAGRAERRHRSPVRGGWYSPDGATLATADGVGDVQLWDTATGSPAGPPLEHPGGVTMVTFRPDGRAVLVFSHDRFWLWDLAPRRLAAGPVVLDDHKQFLAAAFRPDGSSFVTTDTGWRARRWVGATGTPAGEAIVLPDVAWAAAFRPDGGQFAVGFGPTDDARKSQGNPAGVLTFEATTGRPDGPALSSPATISALVYRPDGGALLAGDLRGATRLFIADGGMVGGPIPGEGRVVALALSPDGHFALAGSDAGTGRLCDAVDGRPVGPVLTLDVPARAAFLPDGRRLAVAGSRGIRVLDTGVALAPGPLLHEGADIARFAPDGRTLLTAGPDGTARLWDVATRRPVGSPMAHRAWVSAAAFSPDGRTIATGGQDATLRLWDARGLPRHPPIPLSHWANDLRFSPDGSRLLVTCEQNGSHLIDPRSGTRVGPGQWYEGPVSGVAVHYPRFSPDGRFALTCWTRNMVARLDARTGLPAGAPWDLGGTVSAVEYNPAGGAVLFLVGGRACIYDPESGRPLTESFGEGLLCCTYMDDGRRVVSGGTDRTLRFWDAATGLPAGNPIGPFDQPIRQVVPSGDGRMLLTVTQGGRARLWDVASRRPVGPEASHVALHSSAIFAPNDAVLATIDRGVQLRELPAPETGPVEAIGERIVARTGLAVDPHGAVGPIAVPPGVVPPIRSAQMSREGWEEQAALRLDARGDHASAAWHLRRAVAGRPGDWYPRALLAQALGRLGLPAEAEVEAAAGRADAGPTRAGDWDARLGYDALAGDRWGEAVEAFSRTLAVDRPDAPDLHDARGRARMKLKDWPGAAADFRLGPWRHLAMTDDFEPIASVAVVGDDQAFYREFCRARLARTRDRGPGRPENRLRVAFNVWLASLGPGGADDPEEPIRLAEAALGGVGAAQAPEVGLPLGMALCRAARWPEAVRALDAVRASLSPDDTFEADAFLALAHRRLGHDAEADRIRDGLRRAGPTGNALKDALRRHLLAESDPPGPPR